MILQENQIRGEKMEYDQIIEAAISAEQYAHDLYMKAHSLAKSKIAKDLLLMLAGEELTHKQALEKLYLEKKGDTEISPLQDPLQDLGFTQRLQLTPLNELQELKHILKVAIEREEHERLAYQNLMKAVDDPKLKQIFEKLSMEETRHKALLEKEFSSVI